MSKIVVLQNHTPCSLGFTLAGGIFVIITGLYAALAPNSIDRLIGLIFFLVIASFVGVEHVKRYVFLKKGYVSALQISDDTMTLVYAFLSSKKITKIKLEDIKKFSVEIKAGMISKLITRGGSSSARVYKIKVIIETSKFSLEFFVHPNNTDPSSNLDFMYPLLDVSEKIPNFSYKIEGDSFLKEVLQDYIKSKI